jgi:LacI family transcriptional regulator
VPASRARGRVRLLDVAAAAGVSKSVASRALAGAPDIAEGTKDRVRRAAHELGFRASVRARLLTQRSGALLHAALVTLNVTPEVLGASFLGPILAGILSGAADERLELQHVAVQAGPGDVAAALAGLVAEDRADGLIVLTFLPLAPEDVAPLDESGVPYVLVNRHFGAVPVNCVTFAWEEASRDAVLRLARDGHRRLALLVPDLLNTGVTGREDGWRAGLRELGLDEREAPILRFRGSPGVPDEMVAGGRDLTTTLLRDGLPGSGRVPTAIVGFNDWCALGILRTATAAGLTIPDDLSVVGFDSTRLGDGTSPPLCSYRPRFIELGRRGAGLLAETMRDAAAPRRRLTVAVDFVHRGSCGPAPRAAAG